MSRDLSFWKYKENVSLNDEDVYKKLISAEVVNEVEELPVEKILSDIKKTFEGWKWNDNSSFENDGETVELYITNQVVRFDCYGVTETHMNMIIDIMDNYDCPLYDSAISIRFC